MKQLILLPLLLFCALNAPLFAQYGMGKPKEIKELAERKLMVIQEEPSTKAIDKLKKKGETAQVEKVMKMYEEFNALVQHSVEQKWTMHQQAEYKTWTQFKKMDAKKREKYCVMYFLSKRASSSHSGYVAAKNLILEAGMDEETTKEHDFTDLFQTFTIDKGEDIPVDKIKFGNPVFSLTLPEIYPGPLSVYYALQGTNSYFEKRLSGEKNNLKTAKKEVAENSARLADKTLLLREDWLDEDLTPGKIKELYPHPFRIVTRTELEETILSGDKSAAWLVILPAVNSSSRSNSVIFMQQFIDNENGDALAMYLPGMGNMMLKSAIGGRAGRPVLTEKILKEMVEDISK